jgi:L-arabinose isomerase
MLKVKAGFVVYGVHKDGLCDPLGTPFIDEKIVDASKKALMAEGISLAEHKTVVATKQEAKEALLPLAKDDSVDCLVLFSGTWVWSAHMIAAVREFAKTGKGIVIWTHDGSQGWRPVGGFVLSAALGEVGIVHRFVYGGTQDPANVKRVASYCKASALKRSMEMTTLMAFGGRGMGQTCGVADPSQWMKMFGIDIDSRDTHELVETAKSISETDVAKGFADIARRLGTSMERTPENKKSMRLYLALKALKEKEGFDYYTIQSFPGLGDYYCASCFAQSMMLDDRIPTSTLSDYNTALTSIIITNLSDDPIYYGDLQHVDKAKKEIKIIGDGAVPPSLADSHGVSFASHGIPTEGEAGGLSISLICKPGKGVLARVSRQNGQMRMVIVRCDVFVPEEAELEARRRECGIPFWPHAFVHVHGDIEKMLANWNNEYSCLGYGEDLYDQIVDFCQLTGMEAILP